MAGNEGAEGYLVTWRQSEYTSLAHSVRYLLILHGTI